ncbi:hypothetical protein J6590_029383 [Homalodisca vitripennis]|nr:hypothetical protein J6590_029383 [Homalodisca vitripennis]
MSAPHSIMPLIIKPEVNANFSLRQLWNPGRITNMGVIRPKELMVEHDAGQGRGGNGLSKPSEIRRLIAIVNPVFVESLALVATPDGDLVISPGNVLLAR